MNFVNVLLMDHWLNDFMNDRLMLLMNDLLVLLDNDILMMLMNYVLVLFLNDGPLYMSLNDWCICMLLNFGL